MEKGLHHYHQRKRLHEKKEKYPHPDKWKRIMDKLIYVVGIIGPLTSIPQMINIWVYGMIEGVSVITWAALAVVAFFWVIYGVMHRERPIIVAHGLWVIFDILIVLGVLLV